MPKNPDKDPFLELCELFRQLSGINKIDDPALTPNSNSTSTVSVFTTFSPMRIQISNAGTSPSQGSSISLNSASPEIIAHADNIVSHIRSLRKLFPHMDTNKIKAKFRELENSIKEAEKAIDQVSVKSSEHIVLEKIILQAQEIATHLKKNSQYVYVNRMEKTQKIIETEIALNIQHHFCQDLVPLFKEAEKQIDKQKRDAFSQPRSGKIADLNTVTKQTYLQSQPFRGAHNVLEVLVRIINKAVSPEHTLKKVLDALDPLIGALGDTPNSKGVVKVLSDLETKLINYQKTFPQKMAAIALQTNEYVQNQIKKEYQDFLRTTPGQYVHNLIQLYQKSFSNKQSNDEELSILRDSLYALENQLTPNNMAKINAFDFRDQSQQEILAMMLPEKRYSHFIADLQNSNQPAPPELALGRSQHQHPLPPIPEESRKMGWK